MSESKQVAPLMNTPEDPLTAVPMDYIGFRTGQVAEEARTAATRKRKVTPPKSSAAKSGSSAAAFPLKKRREYNRALESIADGLYFADKLRREKSRTAEQRQLLEAAKSGLGKPDSDKEIKPVYTYKIIPKGGVKVVKEKTKP